MIHLVGIDVDGTLVGKSGVVDPSVWEAADAARAKGIRLVLCSGRPAFGLAVQYARRLGPDGWHAFQNGASVVNLASGDSRSAAVSPAAVTAFVAQARASGHILELYNDREWVTESTDAWAAAHAQLLGVTFQPAPFESLRGPVVRAQWLLTVEQARQLLSRAHPGLEASQSTSPLMPGTQFVGFTREGVSKGSAIRAIAEQYAVALSDVMYIGDSGNDLSALRVVGHPVAMGNADPAVIEAAERVVAHVDEAGVAEAIRIAMVTT